MRMKKIFKRSLAIELLKRGNQLVSIGSNKFHKDKQVYIFKDTLKLREDLHSIQLMDFERNKRIKNLSRS
ncbi:hypothetical protein NST12_16970 [Bacillus sp. FSL W8-1127]|uniref:hypothetical protein n=1 Tax=Bacillus sp. FSL W8-1127 TaxID=2954710 RepID=UPI0030F53DC9